MNINGISCGNILKKSLLTLKNVQEQEKNNNKSNGSIANQNTNSNFKNYNDILANMNIGSLLANANTQKLPGKSNGTPVKLPGTVKIGPSQNFPELGKIKDTPKELPTGDETENIDENTPNNETGNIDDNMPNNEVEEIEETWPTGFDTTTEIIKNEDGSITEIIKTATNKTIKTTQANGEYTSTTYERDTNRILEEETKTFNEDGSYTIKNKRAEDYSSSKGFFNQLTKQKNTNSKLGQSANTKYIETVETYYPNGSYEKYIDGKLTGSVKFNEDGTKTTYNKTSSTEKTVIEYPNGKIKTITISKGEKTEETQNPDGSWSKATYLQIQTMSIPAKTWWSLCTTSKKEFNEDGSYTITHTYHKSKEKTVETTHPNGTVETYMYDDGELTQIWIKNANGTRLDYFNVNGENEYTYYDKDGNKITKEEYERLNK